MTKTVKIQFERRIMCSATVEIEDADGEAAAGQVTDELLAAYAEEYLGETLSPDDIHFITVVDEWED